MVTTGVLAYMADNESYNNHYFCVCLCMCVCVHTRVCVYACMRAHMLLYNYFFFTALQRVQYD